MFNSWKWRGYWMRTKPEDGNLDNLSAEKFISLLEDLECDNARVTGEELLEYIVKNQRRDLFRIISIEKLISMAYAHLTRDTGNLSGANFLKRDRAHCQSEQLDLLLKAAEYKNELYQPDYDNFYLHQLAVFEICRRNDAALLEIYLDEFNGFCPADLYDTVFDYYVYMNLPDWDLLEQYNREQNMYFEDDPGCLSKQKDTVSADIQQNLLDVLMQQADKCDVPRPDALKILLQHGLASARAIFPIRKAELGLGMEFSARETYDTMYAGRILLHDDSRDVSEKNCIDPWDLSDMLIASSCGFPVTCTCGLARDAGIETLAESWIFEKQARLYIPINVNIYFFKIENRFDFLDELLLMLRHIIRTLQCHTRWQKNKNAPPDHNDRDDEKHVEFLPHGRGVSSLRTLCKTIAKEIENKN